MIIYSAKRLFTAALQAPALILASAALSGCSLNRLAVRQTAAVVQKGMPAIYAEKDPRFAREALPGNLKLMEMLIENDPENSGLLTTAAQGFCGYAFMFIEDEDEARASLFYEKGSLYALRALKKAGVAGDKGVEAGRLTAKLAGPAFWHVFCQAAYVNVNRSEPEAVAMLPEILETALRLAELAPGYYFNGPYAVLGAYYSMLPKMMGGDPLKAGRYFEKSLEGAGAGFLLNRYMSARMYAVAAQDPDYFTKQLESIINSPVSGRDTRLANEVAKIKAARLLERKNDFF